MQKMFLIGLTVFALGGCNKKDQAEPAVADDEQAVTGEGRGGGGHHARFCEGPDAEAHIAKMQKCQSEVTAACNTQVYGSATPTKDAICGDKEKMRAVWKCTREKYGADREKEHADRKKMHECTAAQ